MRRNWKPHTELVECEVVQLPLQIIWDVPQLLKHRITSSSTLRYIDKINENIHLCKNLYTKFIATLFMIAKKLTQSSG